MPMSFLAILKMAKKLMGMKEDEPAAAAPAKK